jgi:plasmid stabilization system protein ParE
MLTLKRHRLVRVDFRSAFAWYESQRPGLGLEFAEDFRRAYYCLRQGPLAYSVRFASVRRLNLDRFPYGIFYAVMPEEVRVPAVLHASRDTEEMLAERRRTFNRG